MGAGRAPASRISRRRKPSLKKLWPQIRALVAPRTGLLVFGLFLMGINRVAGLVLPYISKPLLDKVLAAGHPELLPKYIVLVFSAMAVQAITSFSLTQLLSKAGQRLIAEMRRQVQRHVGLLSVAYYDENRTGTLVSRIMTDVEGVRNLVGTGLVEFVGGMVTAVLAFFYLLHRSVVVTITVFSRGRCIRLRAAVRVQEDSPHLSRARQDQRRGHRATDRVARRGARHQGLPRRGARSHGLFGRRRAPIDERDEVAHPDQHSGLGLNDRARPGVGARDVARRARGSEPYLDGRRLFQLQHVSRLHDCPGLSDREYRHAAYRSVRRSRPYR